MIQSSNDEQLRPATIVDALNEFADNVQSVYYDIVRKETSTDRCDPCIPLASQARFEELTNGLANNTLRRLEDPALLAQQEGIDMLLDGIGRGIRFGAMIAAALVAVRSERSDQ